MENERTQLHVTALASGPCKEKISKIRGYDAAHNVDIASTFGACLDI